jgi:hypothetical protein
MKSLLFIALTSLFTIFSTTKWEELRSYEGRFQVETPGVLTEKVDTMQTAIGAVPHHTFYWQAEDETADNLFFSVIYYDLPEDGINSDSTELIEEFFINTTESAAKSVRGTLVYKSYEELIGFPGYFWRIDYLDNKAVIKSKAWLVDNRFYELKTISWKEKNVNSDSDKFFESFKLLVAPRENNNK